MYKVYLDEALMPVAPESIKIEIKNQNKTINLIDGKQANLVNPAGLTKYGFKLLLPYNDYPWSEKGSASINEYLDYFEKIKTSKNPINLKILCIMPDNNHKYDVMTLATLESYTVTESTDLGMDTEVEVEFLEYEKRKTERLVMMNLYVGKKYKIKKGDTLKKIAKKKMGDDEFIDQNAEAIYKENKKELIRSARKAGKKCLHGKNLIAGTWIYIPWHVNTPEEDLGSPIKHDPNLNNPKKKNKKKTLPTTQKKVVSSGKKTSGNNVKKTSSTPKNTWTDLWGDGYNDTSSSKSTSSVWTDIWGDGYSK